MKGKLWILFLIGGIVCALSAGYLLFNYLMQAEEAERTVDSLRELKKQVQQEASATEAAEPVASKAADAPASAAATDAQPATAEPADNGADEQPEVALTPGPEHTQGAAPERIVDPQQPAEADATAEADAAPTATAEPTAQPSPTPFVLTRELILPEYQELYDINPELIGWLTIDETSIDYPVMQSAHPDYYLTHDFYGNKNSNGTLVMDEHCDVYKPSRSLLIHGHNMKNGKMFKALLSYASESFGTKHLTIRFDTLVDHREYQLVAAFYSKLYDEESEEEGFRYYVNVQDANSAAYFVNGLRSERRYDTGVEFGINDEYIVLSTCSYHVTDGRFVVVAKRVK